jgi:hypothetical protein
MVRRPFSFALLRIEWLKGLSRSSGRTVRMSMFMLQTYNIYKRLNLFAPPETYKNKNL